MKRVTLCCCWSPPSLLPLATTTILTKRSDALAALQSNAPTSNMVPPSGAPSTSGRLIYGSAPSISAASPRTRIHANCAAVLSQTENSSAKGWLGGGTNVPFGLQPQPTGSPSH